MILAAGRGERMRPLTDTTPKPLLQVGDDSLIGWHLRRLKAAGIEDVVINHAWLGAQIEAALGNGAAYGVAIRYSPEGAAGLETAGGIATALPFLGDRPFLVVNGDVLTDIDFSQLAVQAASLRQHKLWAHLWLVPNPPHHPEGDFGVDHDGRAHDKHAGNPAYTFSGVGLYEPELFNAIAAHSHAKLAPLLREAMAAGRVSAQVHPGLWLDVGTQERLAEADALARQGGSAFPPRLGLL